MWQACKTMGPPPKTMPQKVMPPSLTAPIALFVVAPCFVFGVVIRCAMKLLPCKILGDARKSRQHAVFERCPERCPPWWKQTCQEHLAQATCRAKACRAHLQSAAPAKHLTLPVHAVMPNYPELRWSRTTLHASTRPALRQPSTLHCLRILWC